MKMAEKSLCVETILIKNGRVRNIKYHNERCNDTRRKIYGSINIINLRRYIKIEHMHRSGEVKCRIIYDQQVRSVTYEPYVMKEINTLKITNADHITYDHKYVDREQMTDLFQERGAADDMLMTRGGFITDSYYGNVALLQDGVWYTPQRPLLFGIRRSKLLRESKLIEREIHIKDLRDYEVVAVFNAMIPFGNIVLPVANIS